MPPSNRQSLDMPEYRKSQVLTKSQLKELVQRAAASTPERIAAKGKENNKSDELDNSSFHVESSKLIDHVPNTDGNATKIGVGGGIEPTPISVNYWMEKKRTLDLTGHTSKQESESICNTTTHTVTVKNTTGSTAAEKRKLFVEQLYKLSRRHVDGNDQASDATSLIETVSQLEMDNASSVLVPSQNVPKASSTPASSIPAIVSEPTFLVEEDRSKLETLLSKISEWSTAFECATIGKTLNLPSLARYGADCYESLNGSDIDDDDGVNLGSLQSLSQSQAMTTTSYERRMDRWNFPSMFRAENVMSAVNRTKQNNILDTDRDKPPGIMDTGSFSYTFRESMAHVQDAATDILDKIGTWEDYDASDFGDDTFYYIDDTSYLQSSVGSRTYEDTTIDTRNQFDSSFDESAMS